MLSWIYLTLSTPEENRFLLECPPAANVVAMSKPHKEVTDKRKGKKRGIEVFSDGKITKQISNYCYS